MSEQLASSDAFVHETKYRLGFVLLISTLQCKTLGSVPISPGSVLSCAVYKHSVMQSPQ
jgi:hypothetical protein